MDKLNLSINEIIYVTGFFQGLFLCTLLIFKNEKKKMSKIILSCIILLLTIDIFEDFLLSTKLMVHFPRFYNFTPDVLSYFVAPLFYLYALSKTVHSFTLNKFHLLLFLPAFIGFVYFIPTFFITIDERIVEITTRLSAQTIRISPFSNPFSINALSIYFSTLFNAVLFYLGLESIYAKKKSNPKEYKQLKSVFVLLAGFVFIWLLAVINFYSFPLLKMIHINIPLLLTAHFYIIVILEMRGDKKVAYSNTTISEEKSNLLLKAILYELVEKKIFRDIDLTILKLANAINSKPHEVSQVLNEYKKSNFNEFINLYRIEDAKCRLKSDEFQNYTISAIANDSGFKSKTTFNNYFKKITGQTPSSFKMNS